MKDVNEISLLIDFYGKLLTEKKISYLQDHYFHDLSLGEIALKNNVSKSAIFDSISHSIQELKNYEAKLNFIKMFSKRWKIYDLIEDNSIREKLKQTEIYVYDPKKDRN